MIVPPFLPHAVIPSGGNSLDPSLVVIFIATTESVSLCVRMKVDGLSRTGIDDSRCQSVNQNETTTRNPASFAWIDLWRLFTNPAGIDNEFERIRVLILFHQLQIGEPLSAFERTAPGKLWLCRFDQIRCHLYLPSAARRSAALTICASESPR